MSFIETLSSKSFLICMLLIFICSVLCLPVFYPTSGLLVTMMAPALLFLWLILKYKNYLNKEISNRSFFYLTCLIFIIAEFFYCVVALYYPLRYMSDALVVREQSIFAANMWKMDPQYLHYFQMFPNNMQIMVPFAIICRLFGSWKAVEIVGVTLVNLSVFFSGLTVRNLCKSNLYCIIAMLVGHFYIGIGFNTFSAYSHNYGLLFPILCLFIYTCNLPFVWRCIGVVVFAGLGNEIKVTTLIPFIAIAVYETLTWFGRKDFKKFLYAIACVFVIFGSLSILRHSLWSSLDFEKDDTIATSMPFFLAMGQSSKSGGECDPNVYQVSAEMEGCSVSERNARFASLAMNDIHDRGIWGNVRFLARKICMTWSDGTMSALKRDYSNPILQKFGPFYSYPRQIVLYVMYILMLLCPFYCKNRLMAVLYIAFIGVFLYQLIFESQSRYVYMFTPLIVVISITSMFGKLRAK